MSRRGNLTTDQLGDAMPAHADPLGFDSASFRGLDLLRFTYTTDAETVAQILPAELEIDDEPTANFVFASYRFSTAGAFREVVQSVEVRFEGQPFSYVPHIFVPNERAMLAGREREGLPKLTAAIDFDIHAPSPDGLISAELRRPTQVLLAQGIFQPAELVATVSPEQPLPPSPPMLGLRVFGGAVPGRPPAVRELVPSRMEFRTAEIWSGAGSLNLTGASDLSPLHLVPIVGPVDAVLLRDVDAVLHRATTTYPI
ncbi:hypothetical protein YM304_17700 [Ilumatobacter coccineus YM16-304]|uniref:Acetoacetate decarboxylase n=2 Tax=Ilumatobacter coccineus TaxID=467094 RepID=A0A6C7E1R3_ILUCY|nr:hypothetical protein YM304_17700 [Ilumatobacter coccineus YM16-304]